MCSNVGVFQYKQNPEMFKQTARLWSHVYAGAPASCPEYTRKIDKLCAMGFDKVCIKNGKWLVWLKNTENELLVQFIHRYAVLSSAEHINIILKFICTNNSIDLLLLGVVFFFSECSNSSFVLKIVGCGDGDRAATKQLIPRFSSPGHISSIMPHSSIHASPV